MENTIADSAEVNDWKISVVAYQKWENAGQPQGHDLRFWLEAETELRAPGVAARTISHWWTQRISPRKAGDR